MSEWSDKLARLATLRKLDTGTHFQDMAEEIGINSITFGNLMKGKVKKPQRLIAKNVAKYFNNEITMRDMGYDNE